MTPDKARAMYRFLVMDCKTPSCNRSHALKYLGTTDVDLEKNPVPLQFPVPLTLRCPYCRQTHDYSKEGLRQIETAEEPPPDFRDTI